MQLVELIFLTIVGASVILVNMRMSSRAHSSRNGVACLAAAASTWGKVCGVVLTETDANGVVTTHSYDALCRKVRTDLPGGGRVSFDYSNWGDPGQSYNRTSTLHPNGAGEIVQDVYFDGLGRTYLEEVSG